MRSTRKEYQPRSISPSSISPKPRAVSPYRQPYLRPTTGPTRTDPDTVVQNDGFALRLRAVRDLGGLAPRGPHSRLLGSQRVQGEAPERAERPSSWNCRPTSATRGYSFCVNMGFGVLAD